eukprot:Gb_02698 [translate_table: standard]
MRTRHLPEQLEEREFLIGLAEWPRSHK